VAVTVRVRLVSLLREAAGGNEVTISFDKVDSVSLGDVLRVLFEKYPRLGRVVEELEKRGLNVVYLVNGETAEPDRRLRSGDVVTLLPPASGG
jgi:MoaD family protein